MTLSLALLALTLGCSSVQTSGDPEFRLREGETFAWAPTTLGAGSLEGGVPWEEFRGAIASELLARGLQATTGQDADITVRADLAIAVVTRNNDPYFDLYVAERYEQCTLSVELRRNAEPNSEWRGECRDELRDVARTMGGIAGTQWHPVEEERSWHIQDAVGRIFRRLPKSLPKE